jgi:hypothetical protein
MMLIVGSAAANLHRYGDLHPSLLVNKFWYARRSSADGSSFDLQS